MIKLKIEGSGEEIVSLIYALRDNGDNGGVNIQTPLPTPPSAPAEAVPQFSEDQVNNGCAVFYALIEGWSQGFGVEGAEQPDRKTLLIRAIESSYLDLQAFLSHCQGLTRAVKTVAPESWSKVQARLIAENLASVSSALGIAGIADHLEYTNEYRQENLS